MSKKIAVISKKGGNGKTTFSVLVHEALKQAAVNVAVKDYDPQGSSSKALRSIGGQIAEMGKEYDILIFDTPPSLTATATISAAQEADIIIITTTPAPLDLWEAKESAEFARNYNAKAQIRILINKTKAGTTLTSLAGENLKDMPEPVLKVTLAERQCYQHAIVGGWGVLDTKAKEEVLALTAAITSI